MPLILPGNVATATASTTYDVANSVRMDGSSAYMDKTMGTPTDTDKYTFSFWCKRSKLGAQQSIFRSTNGNDDSHVTFQADDTLRFEEYGGLSSIGKLQTTQVFRDASAWYHIVLVYDSGNGTAGNRMRMYVNGTEVTSFGTDNNPSQDANSFFNKASAPLHFGRTDYSGGGNYFSGYVAEVVMCDGQAYAASDFGEFDSDSPRIWKPKDPSGLTFGNNGFYLDFEASDNLGNDANGGTDFSESGLAAIDQSTDTCTNNFATWNPLVKSNGTLSEGNVKYVTSNSSSDYGYRLSTIGVSSGKWYAEVKYTSSSNQALIGIRSREATAVVDYLGKYSDDYAIYTDGHYYNNNSETTNDNASWTNGDIIGIFLDLDNNKLYFSKNGSLYSSTGISITAAASTTTGFYFFSASEWNSSGDGTFELNTGGSPSFSLTSAVNDGEYGSFEYTTTITGDGASKTFKALNTKNLAEFG